MFLHKTFKALNGPLCADVPLRRNYSLTHCYSSAHVMIYCKYEMHD